MDSILASGRRLCRYMKLPDGSGWYVAWRSKVLRFACRDAAWELETLAKAASAARDAWSDKSSKHRCCSMPSAVANGSLLLCSVT